MIDFTQKPLILAPMAGFSDLPFREVVKKFNADLTISEMISSNALVYESKKTLKMLEKSSLENPYIVQIAGADKEVIKKAVLLLNDFEFIDGIDFNCGCPVNKVIKQNAGASLLLNLELLKSLVSTIKTHSKKKSLSVKFRLGFEEKIPDQIAQACEQAGADFISIHARTRKQLYSGKADYEGILKAKKAVKIPVVANGDISFENAKEVLALTQSDALMIGRASIGKPWIFYEIKNDQKISETLKKEIISFHFEAMLKHYGEQGVKLFRKHLHEYSKGYKDASAFRDKINRCENAKAMQQELEAFF
ncbi:tRNA dihydrouridine synthase DusB [Campylobacter sp. MIT 12-8780]|uniref:tRNA dihydrouridine synthase n=1 Tax=unclassified Campylobacter TaxID=2593542 RepID=UPI00115D81F8|nr:MULTISPECIES: tRNA-dihydrouridine synthase [unclassified Campylobacter]NDJ27326.1 tRNA-dihydrouridine synthase [Campylobacter sp. MIT 19-121]TQR40347.1 tRNA dihydrouridine synthase DusB [Campylobacter sp. MIT 12-8780]